MKLKNIKIPNIIDNINQGSLRVIELDQVPFQIQRVFSVVNAQSGARRGQHAHKKCNQLICCVSGEVQLKCDDVKKQVEIFLSPESDAILVPHGIWAEQKYLKDNSVIIVFCDQSYDEQDYIRDYGEYLEWKKEQK